MNNPWKMVPVLASDEMQFAIEECISLGYTAADIWAQGVAWAPVPHADDAEVLEVWKWTVNGMVADPEYLQYGKKAFVRLPVVTRLTAERDGAMAECKRRRDANAGLVEERDGLLAEVARQEQTRLALLRERDELLASRRKACQLAIAKSQLAKQRQAELTKARELLASIRATLGLEVWDQWAGLNETRDALDAFLSTPIAHAVDESCGQDAEAAKGGSDE